MPETSLGLRLDEVMVRARSVRVRKRDEVGSRCGRGHVHGEEIYLAGGNGSQVCSRAVKSGDGTTAGRDELVSGERFSPQRLVELKRRICQHHSACAGVDNGGSAWVAGR